MKNLIRMGGGTNFVCHNEQELKVVGRFCRALATESIDDIVAILEPYRKQNELEEQKLNERYKEKK